VAANAATICKQNIDKISGMVSELALQQHALGHAPGMNLVTHTEYRNIEQHLTSIVEGLDMLRSEYVRTIERLKLIGVVPDGETYEAHVVKQTT